MSKQHHARLQAYPDGNNVFSALQVDRSFQRNRNALSPVQFQQLIEQTRKNSLASVGKYSKSKLVQARRQSPTSRKTSELITALQSQTTATSPLAKPKNPHKIAEPKKSHQEDDHGIVERQMKNSFLSSLPISGENTRLTPHLKQLLRRRLHEVEGAGAVAASASASIRGVSAGGPRRRTVG